MSKEDSSYNTKMPLMKSNNLPLISVPVVTYNSANSIVETLDSVYNQTYQNIELIVSDDASNDDTIEVVKNWLESHKDRFVRTELIAISVNKGVTANYNRAAAACKGDWIKDIDGDDILKPNCIQTYVDYVLEYPDAVCVFSKMIPFRGDGVERQIMQLPINYDFFQWSIEEQYHFLIFEQNHVPAPAAFYNRKKVQELGITNDERIPMMEDWPKWVNYLKKGVHFDFIDKELVMYRQSEASISTSSVRSKAYIQSLAMFYLLYQHKEYWKVDKLLATMKYINAKKQLKDNLFWKILNRGIKTIYRYARHEQE